MTQADLLTSDPVLRTACRCDGCCPSDPLPTWTEAHRHACEARWLAGFETNERRAGYLAGVLVARGKPAYERLRFDTHAVMKA